MAIFKLCDRPNDPALRPSRVPFDKYFPDAFKGSPVEVSRQKRSRCYFHRHAV